MTNLKIYLYNIGLIWSKKFFENSLSNDDSYIYAYWILNASTVRCIVMDLLLYDQQKCCTLIGWNGVTCPI